MQHVTLCLCSLLAATSQFSIPIGQKMQLTGWENANNVRNATCAASKTPKAPTRVALLCILILWLSYLLADNWVICMLSLRCRLLQYAGIRWHQWLAWQQHFFDIFCFMLWASCFLSSSEGEIRQLLEEKDLQCIIKQLSDSVFVICKIINVLVRVIWLAFGSADNSYLDIDHFAYHKNLIQ